MQLSGCRQAFKYAKSILKLEGLRALFRSLPVTLVYVAELDLDD